MFGWGSAVYGSKKEFEGRVTGFTMGTGETLALLPPENATGNFVKIVQRLPVRVELTNYNPDKDTLFVGLSIVPYVYYKEPAMGPHAEEFLQPNAPLPTGPTQPKPSQGDATTSSKSWCFASSFPDADEHAAANGPGTLVPNRMKVGTIIRSVCRALQPTGPPYGCFANLDKRPFGW